MPQLFVLFENASGYGLFEAVEFDDMSALGSQVAKTVDDMSRFGKVVKLTAFQVSCRAAEPAREASRDRHDRSAPVFGLGPGLAACAGWCPRPARPQGQGCQHFAPSAGSAAPQRPRSSLAGRCVPPRPPPVTGGHNGHEATRANKRFTPPGLVRRGMPAWSGSARAA